MFQNKIKTIAITTVVTMDDLLVASLDFVAWLDFGSFKVARPFQGENTFTIDFVMFNMLGIGIKVNKYEKN